MQINNLGVEISETIRKTNVEDTAALLAASEKIKKMIISQDVPADMKQEIVDAYKNLSYSDKIVDQKLLSLISAGRGLAVVAVRSSATAEDLPGASFAGQQASFLNVKGLKDVVESVKKCWASLFEPRAIFYRARNKFEKSSIAVVIQRMVNADKSGVMFTVDPVTGENNIVIEATWGLGEYLVLGEVDPDHYIVSKDDRILDTKIGNKPIALMRDFGSDRSVPVKVPREKIQTRVLDDDEILKIAKYGKQLEEYYGQPQDVEFAIEKNILRIVQTRAVTTKARKSDVKIDGVEILRGLGASPGVATGVVKVIEVMSDVAKIEKGDVLVTTMTSPDLVPTMSKAAAIITNLGGSNCHAAIVSREMGIPAIVGTHEATKLLRDGQVVTVDAYNGIIYQGRIEVKKPKEENLEAGPTATKVKVNLAFSEKLDIAEKVDGVGLMRIEHMITKFGVHPAKLIKEGKAEEYTKLLIEGIQPIAQAFSGKPVWVRTLDARSDEFRNLSGGEDEPHEDNPMLGWHGVRRSIDEPEILKAEFEAVKRLHQQGLTNIHVMLPFVISADEFRSAKQIAGDVGLPESVKMGIMVETPAAALTIEEFCDAGIDFVSFGTNDLTQLSLGVDRNNDRLAKISSEFHPAILWMMKHVIEVCNSRGIESSVCGESGSNPEMAKILVKYGIKSVSCNIDAVDKVKSAVYIAEKG
jgi:pyruvate,water dikinase